MVLVLKEDWVWGGGGYHSRMGFLEGRRMRNQESYWGGADASATAVMRAGWGQKSRVWYLKNRAPESSNPVSGNCNKT